MQTSVMQLNLRRAGHIGGADQGKEDKRKGACREKVERIQREEMNKVAEVEEEEQVLKQGAEAREVEEEEQVLKQGAEAREVEERVLNQAAEAREEEDELMLVPVLAVAAEEGEGEEAEMQRRPGFKCSKMSEGYRQRFVSKDFTRVC
ncbi:unnamed protein product [Merluccius merluccius]